MKNNSAKEPKKFSKLRKALKYIGVGLGSAAVTAFGCWYVFNDKTDKVVITPVKEKNDNDEESIEYMRGYNASLIDMMDYCRENGKSIVATYSAKGFGEENAEYWLIAETTDKKPDLPDILTDDPYSVKLHQK